MFKCVVSDGKRNYSFLRTLFHFQKLRILNCGYKNGFTLLVKNLSTATVIDATTATVSRSTDVSIEEKKRKRSAKPVWAISQEIREFFKNKSCGEEVVEAFPNNIFRKNRVTPETIYLADKDVAETIACIIKKHVVKEDTFIIEINPGIGLLSKKLVDIGAVSLHLYEHNPIFFCYLKNSAVLCNDKVNVFPSDFLSLWKMTFQDKIDNGTRVQDIISRYPKKQWIEEPTLLIVATIQRVNFLKYLMLSLTAQNGIMMQGRPAFFFIMSPSVYKHLTCCGADGYSLYRGTTVLFQLIFEYELLEKLPRTSYVPWIMKYSPKGKKKRKAAIDNDEWLYVVRVVPKKNLYETVESPDKLRELWFFVRQLFRSRSNKLIPLMETWIPGCGVRLILEGYNIFTEVGSLMPEELLRVFNLFRSWPEFLDSSFLTSMETTVLNLDESSDRESSEVSTQVAKETTNAVESHEKEEKKVEKGKS